MAWLQPIWRHNPLPPRYTHTSLTTEMAPCNQPLDIKELYLDIADEWHVIP